MHYLNLSNQALITGIPLIGLCIHSHGAHVVFSDEFGPSAGIRERKRLQEPLGIATVRMSLRGSGLTVSAYETGEGLGLRVCDRWLRSRLLLLHVL